MAIRILFHLLALLPLRALHAIGSGAGWLLWVSNNKRRGYALQNIALCMPELSPAERERIARASLVHEMQCVFEAPFFWLGDKQKLLDSIRQATGEELLDQALARGKGVILLTPHLGGYEAAGHTYATKHPITAIYKKQGGAVEELGVHGRTRTGAVVIAAQGGSTRALILPVLARNEAFYYMPDQDPPEGRGVFVPFFGVTAHTPSLISKLVQESGAAVIFMYSERLPGARGYVAHYFAADEEMYSPDLAVSAAAMNRGIERCVRERPEQYWWSYRRFRRRPPGEPRIY